MTTVPASETERCATSRRDVLACGGLLPFVLASLATGGCRRAAAAGPLLALLEGELAVPDPLAIGRSVVAATPGALDPLDLWRRVLDGLPVSDATALVEMWRTRCRDDFAAERRMSVDGWRLCVSEGMLCAALALEAGTSAE